MGGVMEYNGSAVVAMMGKDCVAIGCDKRLGVNRFQTVSCDFHKVFQMSDKCFVGFAGLATDVQTAHNYLRFRMNLYDLEEERVMKPELVSNLISSILYGRRFGPWFVGPVVAGLDENNKPHISAFDFIGASMTANDFICNGTAAEQLTGICEVFWKPDMNADELFETVSQCLMAGVDRDCLSGWGCMVNIITPEKVITRHLKGRMD
eukprot:Lankesteria_metandrocarpae@DN5023_c0_g1_i1.p1